MDRMERKAAIIGFGCGQGARDHGCADGPLYLRRAGLGGKANWRMVLGTGDSSIPAMATLYDRLAALVTAAIRRGRFPIMLGGDHSMAMGTWRGVLDTLKPNQSFRLIWIDAHMDSHRPETSPSDALHGMPLACLLGHGDPRLALAPGRLRPSHVALLGVRSWEPEEADLLARLGVQVVPMSRIPPGSLARHLRHATSLPGESYGLSIDLDGIDPHDAPGVGSPVPHGIRGGELVRALAPLLRSPHCLGLEIAEYNPHKDMEGRTAAVVKALVSARENFHDIAHHSTGRDLSSPQLPAAAHRSGPGRRRFAVG
ncbi:Arginase (modular protein) [Candidatus Terasakiella magnetica]|nr:Arginase (modular protein) [Candidatus Terasakiella magnetica]